MRSAPGSQYWGTGPELSQLRETMDQRQAQQLFEGISRRMHPGTFGYARCEFRSIYHPVTLYDVARGVWLEITPFDHLTSEDGRGYCL